MKKKLIIEAEARDAWIAAMISLIRASKANDKAAAKVATDAVTMMVAERAAAEADDDMPIDD